MSDQFDLFEGEARKSKGIDLVWNNNEAWIARALSLADAHLPHGFVMGEDLKRLPGIGKPNSPHAYGALVQQAIRHRIISKTGKFKKARSVKNNAHKYELYWRAGFPNSAPAPTASPPIAPRGV